MIDDEETLTAYHEAGHAVIAYALGGEIDSVGLYAEADEWLPERYGDCRISWGRVDVACPWQLQREVLTILSGPVAEMIYLGDRRPIWEVAEWRHDWDWAWRRLGESISAPGRRSEALTLMTEGLWRTLSSESCWAAIAAVADELLAHEYVDGEHLQTALAFWLGRR